MDNRTTEEIEIEVNQVINKKHFLSMGHNCLKCGIEIKYLTCCLCGESTKKECNCSSVKFKCYCDYKKWTEEQCGKN